MSYTPITPGNRNSEAFNFQNTKNNNLKQRIEDIKAKQGNMNNYFSSNRSRTSYNPMSSRSKLSNVPVPQVARIAEEGVASRGGNTPPNK